MPRKSWIRDSFSSSWKNSSSGAVTQAVRISLRLCESNRRTPVQDVVRNADSLDAQRPRPDFGNDPLIFLTWTFSA